jgi:short-subunit dehydrogenase
MSRYQNALVTGASSGMGKGLARALGARGTHVVLAARRRERLETLRQEIVSEGGSAEVLVLDCADGDATHDTVRALDDRLPLDLVIANAGVGTMSSARKANWAATRQILDVNLVGAVATLYGALPGMMARKQGHLVGVASVAGFGRGLPRLGAYSASKAGLISFLEAMRLDLQGTGVLVTTVCPGYVRTEMTAKNKLMPFIVEVDDAVATILTSLDKREALCSFPLPIVASMRGLALLPHSIYEKIAHLTTRFT